MGKYIDGSGLSHFMGIIKGWAVPKTRKVNGHALSADVTVTASDIGVASGAEVNQNAFSNVKVGSTTIAADAKQDTFEMIQGNGVSLIPNTTNSSIKMNLDVDTDVFGFSSGVLTANTVGSSNNGVMTPALLTKLNGIATGAEVNQSAFSNVKVGSTTVAADAKTDTLEFVGSNVTLTPDATNDKVTIGITASNINAALGTTPVARATGDADGKSIADYYVKKTFMVDGVSFERDDAAMRYVICDTAAGTATKDIIVNGCADYSNIPSGLVVYVEFVNTNTAAVANLKFQLKAPYTGGSGYSNVGSATAIKYRGGNLPSVGTLAANRIYAFVYDGTNWELMGDLDTNTVYTHPSYTAHSTSAIYKFTNDATGHVNSATAAVANDIVTLLDTTPVNRATNDASGNKISTTYAPKASPALTGTPTAPTAAAGTNTTQIATTAFVTNAVSTATTGALQYKGVVTAESGISGTSYKKGWYWIVSMPDSSTTSVTIAGKNCEAGDMVIAKQDKTSTLANDLDIIQSNIEVLSNSEIDTLWAAA